MHSIFSVFLSPATSRLMITGELEPGSHDQLKWRLAEADRLGGETLQLDLAGVTFIDASCLRLIEQTRQRLEAEGRRLQITAASLTFQLVSSLAGYTELAAVPVAAVDDQRVTTDGDPAVS